MFDLNSKFTPSIDQRKAIDKLVDGIKNNKRHQVLLGATGTGKTFTISNVIKEINKPTIVMAHNKTLAGQLYAELKEFFPNNRVEYFISNFDFYQPEAYIPKTDTYIDKNALTNEEIEKLGKLATTVNKVSTRDIPYIVSKKLNGATTVSATSKIASMAGIKVFATGGIGGVHRGAETTFDISADLEELSDTNICVTRQKELTRVRPTLI